ncbi:MAG: MinD/ParA family ATP-binding protein [Prochlorotrichaceae cyanobacterium]
MNPNPAKLRKDLEDLFPGQFELEVGESNFVLLTIVSEYFREKNRTERLKEVETLIQKAGLIIGIIELYTPEEANAQGMHLRQIKSHIPTSWSEAINMLENGRNISNNQKYSHPIRRVVFYSYKGGVGRTTALIQTAFQLTRSGQRVTIVDMDVEAPGLQTLMPPYDKSVNEGLIDYLWERQTCLLNYNQPETQLNGDSGIVYSVTDLYSKRPLFVVPAGKIDRRYVKRLSVLGTVQLFAHADDPWFQFEQELWEQFQPDIMLIDARTGLNEWGGLSLLELADDAFIILYPSEQNAEGVRFISNLLRDLGGVKAKLILSPVPEGIIGTQLVEQIKSSLKLNESQKEELIQIPYHPNIAGSTQFPVETALPYYASIANDLLEKSNILEADTLITSFNRLDIVRSLSFPERDAGSILDSDFDTIFQKTTDFDRCLDDAVWVIRGRKGTGKSTLYRLFTKHRDNAEKRSQGRLNNIRILSAHGVSDQFRPTADVFTQIQSCISQSHGDWLSLWRAYAIVRIYRSCPEFSETLRKKKMKSLQSLLNSCFDLEGHIETWETKHTNKLVELATDHNLSSYCRDSLSYYNQELKHKNEKIWLLYDDLDQDIHENTSWQQNALGGLMRFVYDLNNQGLYHIRFKVFLREDIWSNLVFTNKSHFGDARTLLLQWGKIDFFRLAYRLAIGGSTEFKTLSNRILPLAESQIDEASEDTLRQALAPLWGLKTAKGKNAYVTQWVYTRLTDSSGNTYPRSLTILLREAQKQELESSQRKTISSDRLLSWKSLTKGLEDASIERCNSIKNEYPDLSEFFDNLNELSSLFKKDDLETLWKKYVLPVVETPHKSFDKFVTRLEEIGLIATKKYSNKYDYSIADLYVYGFKVRRRQGQRK